MKITMYTVTDCPFCAEEKKYLTEKGLQFEENNLEGNREYLARMLEISDNFAGTPVTEIVKDGGEVVVLKGFTKEEFDQALGGSYAGATSGDQNQQGAQVTQSAPQDQQQAQSTPGSGVDVANVQPDAQAQVVATPAPGEAGVAPAVGQVSQEAPQVNPSTNGEVQQQATTPQPQVVQQAESAVVQPVQQAQEPVVEEAPTDVTPPSVEQPVASVQNTPQEQQSQQPVAQVPDAGAQQESTQQPVQVASNQPQQPVQVAQPIQPPAQPEANVASADGQSQQPAPQQPQTAGDQLSSILGDLQQKAQG